jgi:ankyrin repeat protein
MKNLLEQQNCSPDVVDNYGETLINFAIKNNKMKSLDLLLANKVDVCKMNSQ